MARKPRSSRRMSYNGPYLNDAMRHEAHRWHAATMSTYPSCRRPSQRGDASCGCSSVEHSVGPRHVCSPRKWSVLPLSSQEAL